MADLDTIGVGAILYGLGDAEQPGFAVVGFIGIAGEALVIGKIQFIGIVEGDAEL